MVLKMFTYFETPSVGLLYLLQAHFDEVWVSKPACSRASNAETYLVAKGERVVHQRALQKRALEPPTSPLPTTTLSLPPVGFKSIDTAVLERLMDFVQFELPKDDSGARLALINPRLISTEFLHAAREVCSHTQAG